MTTAALSYIEIRDESILSTIICRLICSLFFESHDFLYISMRMYVSSIQSAIFYLYFHGLYYSDLCLVCG